ncbi:MAG TPA: carboxylesterase family protein, partial [Candidatus Obscuribacterales bacterium]
MIHPKVGQKTTARPIVSTNAGPILGRSEGQTDVYRGVPYARPPLGHLRWQPPLPPVPWTAIRDAGSYGPACIQVDPVTRRVFGSEDCLSLNIWRPCGENGLPVMVYLHGGNNVMG